MASDNHLKTAEANNKTKSTLINKNFNAIDYQRVKTGFPKFHIIYIVFISVPKSKPNLKIKFE